MADNRNERRGNHGVGRFVEEGMYSVGWSAFTGGAQMLGKAAGKWFEEGGAEKIMNQLGKEAQEEGHREAWDIAQKMEDPYGDFIIKVRKYVNNDPNRPAGDHKLMRNLGLMYISLINGYANTGNVKEVTKRSYTEASPDNEDPQEKVATETTVEKTYEGDGLELFKDSLKSMIDRSTATKSWTQKQQYEEFLDLMKGYENRSGAAMFASAKFWMSKAVQKLLPAELRGRNNAVRLSLAMNTSLEEAGGKIDSLLDKVESSTDALNEEAERRARERYRSDRNRSPLMRFMRSLF